MIFRVIMRRTLIRRHPPVLRMKPSGLSLDHLQIWFPLSKNTSPP